MRVTVYKADHLWKPAWTDLGFWQWDRMFGYMLINQSRDVIASLACYSYFKLVRLGGFKSVENDYLNGDVPDFTVLLVYKDDSFHFTFFFLL
mgnify:CR=1 FL=1